MDGSRLIPSFARRGSPLASAAAQLTQLQQLDLPAFASRVSETCPEGLRRHKTEILQLNLGKRCNQTCRHCHVDAGPDRSEVMSLETLESCLKFVAINKIPVVDITGGAPELHPHFRELVESLTGLGVAVMDRNNLTLNRLPNYRWIPEFLARHRVEVVASLPSTALKLTDRQRGDGVFEQSIVSLQELNSLGYGREGTGLKLTLVTNPGGAFLPGNQSSLEREWKRELQRKYGIEFTQLFAITNMPISRFLEFLIDSGNLQAYMEKLVSSFNPAAVSGVMCRNTLSIGWDGRVYDCDFNQMLELELPVRIHELTTADLTGQPVRTHQHCFGCTAGAGSSCGGTTV